MKTNLSRALIILFMSILFGTAAHAQNRSNTANPDYASYPYWMEMMQDPNGNFFETQKAFYTYWKDRTTTRGDGYKPFKRWEYYWQTRVNPDGTFPEPDKTFREYNKYVQDHPEQARLKTGQAVWSEMGPKTRMDIGGYNGIGRVNAIAFHPTDPETLYAGAPKGGLWVTHNGGATWTSNTDILPTLGVSAIFINKTDPNKMLIGTGDRDGGDAPGMGVFSSSDGGLTWAPSNTGMGNVTVGMFAAMQSNPNIILAATSGGIFKTTDGGINWILKTSKPNTHFKDVKIKPGSASIAYTTFVATNSSGTYGFLRSEDGGETWIQVNGTDAVLTKNRMVIGVTPANDSLVYILGGGSQYQGCFISRNFGTTFTTQSTSPNILGYAYDGSDDKSQAGYDLDIHVDPFNPLVVFIGGINLWKSVDGAKTWQIVSHWWGDRTNEVHADQHTLDYNPLNNRLYAGNDGGVYFTANQGSNWTEISEGLGIGQLYKIGLSNTDSKKMVAGFQDNGTATWIGTNWYSSDGGDGMECAVDPVDPKYSYTTIYYGRINRHIGKDTTRTIAGKGTNGITEDGAWVTPFIIGGGDGNTMVIGYKNIWISRNIKSNGTITWKKISDNLGGRNDLNFSDLKQSPIDFNLLFAARWDDRKFFRTETLLANTPVWIDISANLPVNAAPSDIECSPYDASVVYIILSNRVYKSINKGSSWVNISGNLPNIPMKTIVFDRSSIEGLYVGTDAGIYYKDTDGGDWVKYGTGFPVSVGVNELEIYQDIRNRNNSVIRAATFGRGVWETKLAETSTILPPSLLTATVTDAEVELNWKSAFYETNLQGYNVYRDNRFVEMVSGNTWTDTKTERDITYTYKVTAQYNNGTESTPTNEASATILSEIKLPYSQPFENGTAGWTAKYTMEGWRWGTPETLSITGREGHFFAANSAAAGNGINVKDYLVTPTIDLSSYTDKTITLKFAYTMRKYRTYDKFNVNYRVDPDSAWVKLVDLKPPSTTTWLWDTTQIDLPAKALTANAQFGFYYDNSNQFAWGAALDDVELFLNTTSAKSIVNPMSVRVFPNPSQGRFTIDLPSGMSGDVSIKVINLDGQVVIDKTIGNYSGSMAEKLDMSNQAKGIYQLVIRSKDSEWKQKITIQ